MMETTLRMKSSLREHRRRERAWCQARRRGLRAEAKKRARRPVSLR